MTVQLPPIIPDEYHLDKRKDSDDAQQLSKMYKVVLDNLELKETDNVLDLGCGTGIFLKSIFYKINHGVGIDNDGECILICRQHVISNILFDLGDVCKLGWDGEFDIVTAICILEHVDNPTALIREAYRVCKPNGKAVFVTPNLGRGLRFMRALVRKDKWTRSGHKQGWDYHLLKKCLEYNGWVVDKIVTRFVDCPFYSYFPKSIGDFISHRVLLKLFPRVGSELYAFCTKK